MNKVLWSKKKLVDRGPCMPDGCKVETFVVPFVSDKSFPLNISGTANAIFHAVNKVPGLATSLHEVDVINKTVRIKEFTFVVRKEGN